MNGNYVGKRMGTNIRTTFTGQRISNMETDMRPLDNDTKVTNRKLRKMVKRKEREYYFR